MYRIVGILRTMKKSVCSGALGHTADERNVLDIPGIAFDGLHVKHSLDGPVSRGRDVFDPHMACSDVDHTPVSRFPGVAGASCPEPFQRDRIVFHPDQAVICKNQGGTVITLSFQGCIGSGQNVSGTLERPFRQLDGPAAGGEGIDRSLDLILVVDTVTGIICSGFRCRTAVARCDDDGGLCHRRYHGSRYC